jgi:hypothetical protein
MSRAAGRRKDPLDTLASLNGRLRRVERLYRGHTISVLVHREATQSINNNTETTVSFTDVRHDTTDGDMWDVSQPTRLVVPVDGFYLPMASLAWASNSAGVRVAYFRANGSVLLGRDTRTANAATEATLTTPVRFFNAGDYVELRVFQSSGGALNLAESDEYAVECGLTRQ